MNACAALAITAALMTVASADAGMTVVEIGTFRNQDLGQLDYQGDFGGFVSAVAVGQSTQIDIDVTGILEELDGYLLAGVRLIDTGQNQYGVNSAGADIDLLSISGLVDGVDLAFSYLGATGAHQNESSDDLATRVAAIDAQSGAHEWSGMFHVSLGEMGTLTAMLSSPTGGTDVTPPPLAGANLGLHLSEAGSGESFRVQFLMSLPTPSALSLLGLAAVAGPHRRRRRPSSSF